MTIDDYNSAVDCHSDNLYRFVLKNLKDENLSSDVIQDIYEKLWIKLEDVSAEKVKSYLFTSAYHTMIDYIRKNQRFVNMEPAESTHSAEMNQYSDLREVLEGAIQRLPEDQRSVLMLRDYEGYSYHEISEITGLNESQVKVYIYRARVYLKNYIGSVEQLV